MSHIMKALLLFLALSALASPVLADRFYPPRSDVFDSAGRPLSGAKLCFFESGTSTPKDTYSDDALTTPNTNPVVADSAGRFGEIFLDNEDYKVALLTSAGTCGVSSPIWTADPVRNTSPTSTAVLTKTTTYTVGIADEGKLIAADATSGAFTVTLPAAATAGDGFEISIMKIDSSTNAVTVDGDGTETINGSLDLSLPDAYAATTLRSNGSTWYARTATPSSDTVPLPAGYIDSLSISNNSIDALHDIDIATGRARSDDNQGNIILSSATTKRIDAAFSEGANQGGLDTGSVAGDTLYFLWLIGKTDGTSDVLFSLSGSSPTMPSGFTLKRKIGFVRTDPSANIYGFTWKEDGAYLWSAVDTTTGTAVTMQALPSGIDRIVLGFNGVSHGAANSGITMTIGDSGGLETAGYNSAATVSSTGSASTASTARFQLTENTSTDAVSLVYGHATLFLSDPANNTWSLQAAFNISGLASTHNAAGNKPLSDTLTQFSISNVTPGTFDAGSFGYQFFGHPNPRAL